MLPGENKTPTAHYASPDHLHIGLYVHIDLPWFRHPFTRNSFKISSLEQIRELRALNKARFRYDPLLSEPAPAGELAVATQAAQAPATTENEPAGDPAAESATDGIDARVQQLRDYRKAVLRTEKSFMKAVGVMRRLNRNLISQPAQTLEEMAALVEQMVTVFLDRPDVTLQVMGENCGGDEVFHHGLNVSVLCMMLVRGLALDREQARRLGTGALLHDIGLGKIADHVLKKSADEQTRPERELRARHVEYGADIGKQLGLEAEVLAIIDQHHEFADGSGYPRGLRFEQISPLARIVSLVNHYDNLCNPVDFAQAMTPHEALAYIFARLKNKFDVGVLQVMIRALGVYPPGTVVKLSNDALGIVVSLNPHRALRPWVMLYDASVPKEDAVMLNLEQEAGISISKALRPALLPAPVFAYLSARKRITYFFDGGLPGAAGDP